MTDVKKVSWTNLEEFRRIYEKVPVEEYPNRVLETLPDPILSVKVSTYQHARFIERCLDSILMQKTTFPFEIVIGEDESTDGTREICIEYAERYPDIIRLLLHSRANNISVNGRPSGRFQNTYTRLSCRGKYVALCEGDDYWTDTGKLEKQVKFLLDNPEYVLTCGGFRKLSSEGCKTVIVGRPKDLIDDCKIGFSFDLQTLRHGWFTKTLTVVYRAAAYDPNDFTNYRFTRDVHLYYHILRKGKGFYFRDVLGVYNAHRAGVHSSMTEAIRLKTTYLVYKELYEKNRDAFTRFKTFRFGAQAMKINARLNGERQGIMPELAMAVRTMLLIRSPADARYFVAALKGRLAGALRG